MPRTAMYFKWVVTLSFLALIAGCENATAPTDLAPDDVPLAAANDAGANTVATLDFWPYTGSSPDFAGESDPINLVFVGESDPRDIRAALMSLDGQRSPTFPPAFPFDCTWEDAMGANQTAHAPESGWTGNAVQLQCGTYGALRFHVRLFRVGDQTIANAHLDLLIPGTPTHQVIAWEAAEQFVVFDLARSGLLGASPAATPQINPAPGYRTIPDVIYNGLPVSLRGFIGGPLGNASAPVPIVTNGQATVITLAGAVPRTAGLKEQRLEIAFNQVIPKPFCSAGPTDYVHVQGPVTLAGRYHLTGGGTFTSRFEVSGDLQITPIDITTGLPSGATYGAYIAEDHRGNLNPSGVRATSSVLQQELPVGHPGRGVLSVRLRVGTHLNPAYERTEEC